MNFLCRLGHWWGKEYFYVIYSGYYRNNPVDLMWSRQDCRICKFRRYFKHGPYKEYMERFWLRYPLKYKKFLNE